MLDITVAVVPVAGPGHPPAAGHQVAAEGDAAGRPQAGRAVRRRRADRASGMRARSCSSPAPARRRSRTISTSTTSWCRRCARAARKSCWPRSSSSARAVQYFYTRQRQPLGLGHAVLVRAAVRRRRAVRRRARRLDHRPRPPRATSCGGCASASRSKSAAAVIAFEEVPRERGAPLRHRASRRRTTTLFELADLVEKPSAARTRRARWRSPRATCCRRRSSTRWRDASRASRRRDPADRRDPAR